jgi:hypothetical protein
LRLPAALHSALQAAARTAGLSLNEYCARRLAGSGPALSVDADAAALVSRAAEVAGDALLAVVIYGSWARGDSTATSDVDALVVVDRRLGLTRAVYRTWDESPVCWQGRAVDPHFVHLPHGAFNAGVWGEVAIDGIVLFERDPRLSAHLARVRRAMAEGRLVRRVVHGQPYWAMVA